MFWFPKFSVPGVAVVAFGTDCPVPLSTMVCAEAVLFALSEIVIVSVRVPAAVGAKLIEIVQLDPLFSVVPQLFTWVKSVPVVNTRGCVMVSGPVPELVSVTVTGPFVEPIFVVANAARLQFEAVEPLPHVPVPLASAAVGTATPVPLKDAFWVAPETFPALSVKVRLAPREPAAVGLNATETVQVGCGEVTVAASVVPQVFEVMMKSPAFAPVSAMPEMFRTSVPALVRVTFCAAVVVPMFVFAKVRPADKLAAGTPSPVPCTVIACGEFAALSETLRVACRTPPSAGVNFTAMTQVWPGVSVAPPQPSAEIENSDAFAPLSAAPLRVRFALPVFLTLTFCAALVVPTFCTVENTSGDGLTAAAGPAVTELPVKVIVCGLPVAE